MSKLVFACNDGLEVLHIHSFETELENALIDAGGFSGETFDDGIDLTMEVDQFLDL